VNPDGDLAALAAHPAYRATVDALRAEPRRWLVTGAAGFIGSHLVEALLEADQRVVGLDDLSTGFRTNLEDVARRVGGAAFARFEFREGDLRDAAAVSAAVEGADVVLNHAALVSVPQSIDDPWRAHEVNATGFLNVLDAARHAGVPRVVYASTSAIYGDDDAPTKVEGRLGRALSMYAATKAANEHYATAYAQAYGFTAVGLRYFNVFGSRQDPHGAYAAVIPAWIDRLARGEPCVVHGDGGQTRDFCHVANVVGANLLAATTPARADLRPAFNVGTGHATTLVELFAVLRDALVAAYPDRADLRRAEPVYGPPRAGDVRHSRADVALAERQLGIVPAVSIREGLDRTLGWYLKG
jgi:UDP-N-acetylglucosamine 4-epimerase